MKNIKSSRLLITVLSLVMILVITLVCGLCIRAHAADRYHFPDDLYVDFSMFCYYKDDELSPGYVVRRYYFTGAESDAEPVLYAESFGLEIDDNFVDIDGDGYSALLCNCIYGGDGDRELYVYKAGEGYIWEGSAVWTEDDLPGLDNYGSCAVMTWYAPEIGKIVVDYDAGPGPRRQRYFDFDRLEFTPKVWIGTYPRS